MTIYASYTYPVPGEPNGERHTDDMPQWLDLVWEVEGAYPWWYEDGIWNHRTSGGMLHQLPWDELLKDFGPVTDDEDEARYPELSAGEQFRRMAANMRRNGNLNPIQKQIALFVEAEADKLDGIPSFLWCATCETAIQDVMRDATDHLAQLGHVTELRKPTLEIP